jgi:predicted nucleic acid-binding protein
MSEVPSGPLLFDTGIYIRYFRGEGYEWLASDVSLFQRTILTAVVASELYAGTRSQKEKRVLDELCRAHQALGNLSCPAAMTWTETGILLQRARRRFGQVDFAQHFRDALIAQEAARHGATVVTENVKDFARWKTVMAAGGKVLKVSRP